MFDRETLDLIASAPSLQGLESRDLAKELTAAYTKIVAARIRLRSGEEADHGIESLIDEMRRLAFVQESLVSLAPESDTRRSAAFVAGTAHHVVFQAEALSAEASTSSELRLDAIPAGISSSLLFLIAQAHADAVEMTKTMVPPEGSDSVSSALIDALRRLIRGDLATVASMSNSTRGWMESPSPRIGLGATALYVMILDGVRLLSNELMGRPDLARSSDEVFARVAELSIRTTDLSNFSNGSVASQSTYPGPFHLATLLLGAGKELRASSLVSINPPSGVPGDRWREKMGLIAGSRPYLWKNHLQAVRRGYLDNGVSSVVSFPTGAGKSTLSELKIASALLASRKVVFLAPTLALVDQVARSLGSVFPSGQIQRERSSDSVEDIADEGLPEISVMTPERCLALLGYESAAFAEVGLLVFDEFHLIHSSGVGRDRRSIDAMVCLLNFTLAAPTADLLLMSAMVSNASEVAAWVESLTSRSCLALDLNWKPTRQVRGVVLYQATEVASSQAILAAAAEARTTAAPPASVKRQLQVKPYGFMGLQQTWMTNNISDYLLVPLLDRNVKLGAAGTRTSDWYLTPNSTEVAAEVAIGAATRSASDTLKTLVFTQTIPWAASIAKKVSDALPARAIVLNQSERQSFDAALTELGDRSALYADVGEGFDLRSLALTHHGLLLPQERALHESLYRRPDGVDVVVATSTLAQGMNLPSQVVIISSDQRFDADSERMGTLEAHELLNAAGRAGRAGENSFGFVLVVPGRVMRFDGQSNTISRYWNQLRQVFSQSDQCLAVEDPLVRVLDRMHESTVELDETARYMLRRLPISFDRESSRSAVREYLGRTMGAFSSSARGVQDWVDLSSQAVARFRDEFGAEQNPDWIDKLAASTGVEPVVIRGLESHMQRSCPDEFANVKEWVEWVFGWLAEDPSLVPQLVRKGNLEGLFEKDFARLSSDQERGQWAIPRLQELLLMWMEGKSLMEMEVSQAIGASSAGKCKCSRIFVLRVVPDLAFIFGLPEQLIRAKRRAAADDGESPASASKLSACVKEGYAEVELLALSYVKNLSMVRRGIHELWTEVRPMVLAPIHPEKWAETLARVRSAHQVYEVLR
ncbi:DEAD/DEAH box helicase [Stenotrophomonas maltophilia]|uniref:DEAD/DEAH box helicase n=1 Tax=Stenotrophomonas maltophilia TaxID=40324 RepID=UPI00080B2551|nr:DEAD/DEAH box helicase [Stenotrophomonas maltophilia]MCU1200522.1 DEAD/DEAH box helicase [Stenotrophomonas maltophilia]HDS1824801.1 DEAD/DEAH box helicase [Stenotrophomonas maltophilia]